LASHVPGPLLELFEQFEDVQFWVKDSRHRYVHVNRAFLLNYALDDPAQVIGKTDYDQSQTGQSHTLTLPSPRPAAPPLTARTADARRRCHWAAALNPAPVRLNLLLRLLNCEI